MLICFKHLTFILSKMIYKFRSYKLLSVIHHSSPIKKYHASVHACKFKKRPQKQFSITQYRLYRY